MQRRHELEHAIRAQLPREKLNTAAEVFRAAQLSLLKANLYWAQDAVIRGSDAKTRIERAERETEIWTAKSVDDILQHFNVPNHLSHLVPEDRHG